MASSISIQIVDRSGAVVGNDDQVVGSPFTSGSMPGSVGIPFTGQPSACNVKTIVLPPPGFLP